MNFPALLLLVSHLPGEQVPLNQFLDFLQRNWSLYCYSVGVSMKEGRSGAAYSII